jgi:acyl carrier protein
MEANTSKQLLTLIREETGHPGEINQATRLDSLVKDSLEFLSLICAVENAFDFKIPDKRYAEVQTVGDLCNYAFCAGVSSDYAPS